MDIVLKKDVEGLGKAGDLVSVKGGYARNYLIPRGLAVLATKSVLQQRKSLKEAQEQRDQRLLTEAQEYAEKLRDKTFTFYAKTGNGRIFGSITSQNIANKIKSTLKIPVEKRNVHLSENLKELGTHTVEIQLHTEVRVEITVNIQPEGGQ